MGRVTVSRDSAPPIGEGPGPGSVAALEPELVEACAEVAAALKWPGRSKDGLVADANKRLEAALARAQASRPVGPLGARVKSAQGSGLRLGGQGGGALVGEPSWTSTSPPSWSACTGKRRRQRRRCSRPLFEAMGRRWRRCRRGGAQTSSTSHVDASVATAALHGPSPGARRRRTTLCGPMGAILSVPLTAVMRLVLAEAAAPRPRRGRDDGRWGVRSSRVRANQRGHGPHSRLVQRAMARCASGRARVPICPRFSVHAKLP